MRPIACAALALLVVAAPGAARAIDPAELAALVRLSDGPPPRDALFEGDLHLAEAAASDFDLPVSLRPPVVAWMRYFLGGGFYVIPAGRLASRSKSGPSTSCASFGCSKASNFRGVGRWAKPCRPCPGRVRWSWRLMGGLGRAFIRS